MSKFRLAHLGLVMAAIGFTAATPIIGLVSLAHAADTVRAEVGKPLQEAQKLASSGKNKEALAKLREADSVGNKTAFESYQIERVRASAAAGAGDNTTAIKAFEAVINSGRLSAAEAPKFTQGLAGMYYRAKDWPNAITWINRSLKDKEDPQMRELLIQTYYVSGNYAAAAKELQSRGGNSEGSLQMLANIQLKQNDKAGYVATLEKLAASYPKPSYWADLLNRVSGKPGFSSRLSLDVQRLRLANGLLTKAPEYMELSQLVLQAGNPSEALKVIDQGYKKGALGTGTDAARHQRLKDLATKRLADSNADAAKSEAEYLKNKDADGLSALGFALVSAGQADKGLDLMNQAIKLGTSKYPEELQLHLGIAYAQAGKKSNAVTALKAVKGSDGAADLARYWILQLK
ncbi:tetratricopeptide repeat protein [Janthinobacterium agaricidamnosum]|uniref:Tetratricopeptide repeat family protein n=1 Tax=Janthinobacterium agaricidamnosum NBRC 102515 = DSM 9628 TaxID=1349767 RepID=W0V2J1_9BURK|nr:tetratricopeptide repeat protein [Janthinobacterium agaricidamnosum]CDG81835.1 tetratricopeptide repeat family protein [Janthinobacterium agaricidamnosum NBRC 102515 = DSM 9628]